MLAHTITFTINMCMCLEYGSERLLNKSEKIRYGCMIKITVDDVPLLCYQGYGYQGNAQYTRVK